MARRFVEPVFDFEYEMMANDQESVMMDEAMDFSITDNDILQASQAFEEMFEANEEKSEEGADRFVLKTDSEVRQAARNSVPEQTRKKALWAAGIFEEWRVWRNEQASSNADISKINPPLVMLTKDELDFCMCRFICEMRKTDGSEYPSKTTYEIATSIQKYLEVNGKSLKLLTDPAFKQFQMTLDAEMKRKAQQGVNKPPKQAPMIEREAEEELWNGNHLGEQDPTTLLHTIMYLSGVNFCTRGRTELRNISFGEVTVVDNITHGKQLRYQQTASVKNNQGGLRSRHYKLKDITVFSNDDPKKCFVRLYEKYTSLWPSELRVPQTPLFLYPATKPTEVCWCSKRPVGINSISSILSNMLKKVGVDGATGHSLRRTSITRLFRADVPDKIVKEVSGHRSNDIDVYKVTSVKQKAAVSTILQGPSKKFKSGDGQSCSSTSSSYTMSTDDGDQRSSSSTAVSSPVNPAPSESTPVSSTVNPPGYMFNNCTVFFGGPFGGHPEAQNAHQNVPK